MPEKSPSAPLEGLSPPRAKFHLGPCDPLGFEKYLGLSFCPAIVLTAASIDSCQMAPLYPFKNHRICKGHLFLHVSLLLHTVAAKSISHLIKTRFLLPDITRNCLSTSLKLVFKQDNVVLFKRNIEIHYAFSKSKLWKKLNFHIVENDQARSRILIGLSMSVISVTPSCPYR